MRNSLYLLLFFIFGCSTATKLPLTLNTAQANSDEVLFVGRVDEAQSDFVRVYWPGTAIKFKFVGISAKIELQDEKGENYFNVVIDGAEPIALKLSKERALIPLAENLPKGEHEIILYKRTEWNHGHTDIFKIEVEGSFLAPQKATRTIEFFGNSISTGYAVQDFSGNDKPDGLKTNNYVAYSALTARALNADMYCTAKGGIGVLVSWFPVIMPELYDRLNPVDPNSKWDFSKMTPDVVVVNLLQNDSWIAHKPNNPQFKARFGDTPPTADEIILGYENFLKQVKSVYPNVPIICTLGSMDATKEGSPWPGYVSSAVAKMNDNLISTLYFPFKETVGHPHPAEHQKMADLLIPKIKEVTGW